MWATEVSCILWKHKWGRKLTNCREKFNSNKRRHTQDLLHTKVVTHKRTCHEQSSSFPSYDRPSRDASRACARCEHSAHAKVKLSRRHARMACTQTSTKFAIPNFNNLPAWYLDALPAKIMRNSHEKKEHLLRKPQRLDQRGAPHHLFDWSIAVIAAIRAWRLRIRGARLLWTVAYGHLRVAVWEEIRSRFVTNGLKMEVHLQGRRTLKVQDPLE